MEAANQWLAGAVSVGDALPLPMPANLGVDLKAAQVIPIPLSLGTPKPSGQKTPCPWWAKAGQSVDFITHDNGNTYDGLDKAPVPKDRPKLKRPGTRQFLYRPDAKTAWQRYTPTIEVRMRVNLKMRDSDGKPGLFSHEEIAEKTQFISDLRFNDTKSAEAFAKDCRDLLTQDAWLRIGREGRPVRVVQAIWLDPKDQTLSFDDDWRLTLTSDTILRDEILAFVIRPDITTLIAAAGKEPGDYPGCGQWTINAGYCESTNVHGFNAVTGLRRVPAIALRRGSDFKIDGTGSARLAADLAAKHALGERTTEGYGRFIINFDPFTGMSLPPAKAPPYLDNDEETLLSLSYELTKQLQGDSLPSRSQLGWLRGMAEGGKVPSAILASIKKAAEKQGGKAWKNFPVTEIKEAFTTPFLIGDEGRQRQYLIAVVRWLTPRIKESTEQERTI